MRYRNTIVADGTAAAGPNLFSLGTGKYSSLDYNFIESTIGSNYVSVSHDTVGIDPELGSLGTNGGPTMTRLPSAVSLILNKIPMGTNGCGTNILYDQRNLMRLYALGCDVGAVEIQPVNYTVGGKVLTSLGLGLKNANVTIKDDLTGQTRAAMTNSFGLFTFNNISADNFSFADFQAGPQTGRSYTIKVVSKRFRYASQSVTVNDNLTNLQFTGIE